MRSECATVGAKYWNGTIKKLNGESFKEEENLLEVLQAYGKRFAAMDQKRLDILHKKREQFELQKKALEERLLHFLQ